MYYGKYYTGKPEPDPPYPMTEEVRERIIRAWTRRADAIARSGRYNAQGWDLDDWMAEAHSVLVESVDSWRPNGIPFAAYLTQNIKCRLVNTKVAQQAFKRAIGNSLETAYGAEPDDDWQECHRETASNTISGQQHTDWQPGHSDVDLWTAFDNLEAEDKVVLWAYYGNQETYPEIAKRLHSSRSSVHRSRVAALESLRALMNVDPQTIPKETENQCVTTSPSR